MNHETSSSSAGPATNGQQTTDASSSASSAPFGLSLEVYQECEKVKADMTRLRQRIARHEVIPPAEYFEIGMYLESFRMWLSDYLLTSEAAYREKKVWYLADSSATAADMKARTTPAYQAYKYLERVDLLADEIAKFIKKFQGGN
jgi:hypothetical protein